MQSEIAWYINLVANGCEGSEQVCILEHGVPSLRAYK